MNTLSSLDAKARGQPARPTWTAAVGTIAGRPGWPDLDRARLSGDSFGFTRRSPWWTSRALYRLLDIVLASRLWGRLDAARAAAHHKTLWKELARPEGEVSRSDRPRLSSRFLSRALQRRNQGRCSDWRYRPVAALIALLAKPVCYQAADRSAQSSDASAGQQRHGRIHEQIVEVERASRQAS